MKKIKAAIIGPGNIGTDLLYKTLKNKNLNYEIEWMVGRDINSKGLQRARDLGIKISASGIEEILKDKEVKIVFDATSAQAHKEIAGQLDEAGKKVIDLTPAAVGPYIIPAVNIEQCFTSSNVNLVTCGGQATVPIVAAVSKVAKVEYAEIVATIASNSAGPGTRANIDEFTQTTARAIEMIGGAKKGKAIIILNPAEPEIMMKNTIYCFLDEKADEGKIIQSINDAVVEIQKYVPLYKLKFEPIVEEKKVVVTVEVRGNGDFLKEYAGNLDIITSAAVRIADMYSKDMLTSERRNPGERDQDN